MLDLENKVKKLLENDEYRQKIGVNAYHTMVDLWNAEVAASRFYRTCQGIASRGVST